METMKTKWPCSHLLLIYSMSWLIHVKESKPNYDKSLKPFLSDQWPALQAVTNCTSKSACRLVTEGPDSWAVNKAASFMVSLPNRTEVVAGWVQITKLMAFSLGWVPAKLSRAHNMVQMFSLSFLYWGAMIPEQDLLAPIKSGLPWLTGEQQER